MLFNVNNVTGKDNHNVRRMSMSDDNDLTLNEVCEILDKSPTTIKRYARENLLLTEQNGNVLSFSKAEVMRLACSER
jgi:hypothetical protein|tara:strand:- start:1015 stop:1245 length:231 start_codon:yes stop_codon:yes gene_type:complete